MVKRAWRESERPEGTLLCVHCDQFKPLDAFPTNDRISTGRSSWCTPCHRHATREWRARHRDEENARRRAAYAARKRAET